MSTLHDGDVLLQTSWWRRWFNMERWFIVEKDGPLCFAWDVSSSKEGDILNADRVADPDLWPDEVCAAVAERALLGEGEG